MVAGQYIFRFILNAFSIPIVWALYIAFIKFRLTGWKATLHGTLKWPEHYNNVIYSHKNSKAADADENEKIKS